MLEITLYGYLVRQNPCKFLLDLSNKGAVDSNSHYIEFISLKKESMKCPTTMITPGKPLYHHVLSLFGKKRDSETAKAKNPSTQKGGDNNIIIIIQGKPVKCEPIR